MLLKMPKRIIGTLFRFYTYGLENHFRREVFEDFQRETLRDHDAGNNNNEENFFK